MLKNIKISTPKNIEIYILFLGHWTPAVLHHFFGNRTLLKRISPKKLLEFPQFIQYCWDFAKKRPHKS